MTFKPYLGNDDVQDIIKRAKESAMPLNETVRDPWPPNDRRISDQYKESQEDDTTTPMSESVECNCDKLGPIPPRWYQRAVWYLVEYLKGRWFSFVNLETYLGAPSKLVRRDDAECPLIYAILLCLANGPDIDTNQLSLLVSTARQFGDRTLTALLSLVERKAAEDARDAANQIDEYIEGLDGRRAGDEVTEQADQAECTCCSCYHAAMRRIDNGQS